MLSEISLAQLKQCIRCNFQFNFCINAYYLFLAICTLNIGLNASFKECYKSRDLPHSVTSKITSK